jgi:hypothetical protein
MSISEGITAAIEQELLIQNGSQIKTSAKGSLFLNEILGLFM